MKMNCKGGKKKGEEGKKIKISAPDEINPVNADTSQIILYSKK